MHIEQPATAATLIASAIATKKRDVAGMIVAGICGPQGSGKSTATLNAATLLRALGMKVATLSIDDLYLPRIARRELAKLVHPLLETRGPPGTHDAALGIGIIQSFRGGGDAVVPLFDKLSDDRTSPDRWNTVCGPIDVLLFEGWCVGACAQPVDALAMPVNALEEMCDPDGTWRRHVNDQLAGIYGRLFEEIDLLYFLRAPGFEVVYDWRAEQERNTLLHAADGSQSRGMDAAALRRFIAHYERLTRHIDGTMPSLADLTIELDVNRGVRNMYRSVRDSRR